MLEGASSRALVSSVRALVAAWVLVSALTGDRDLAPLLLLLLLLLRARTDSRCSCLRTSARAAGSLAFKISTLAWASAMSLRSWVNASSAWATDISLLTMVEVDSKEQKQQTDLGQNGYSMVHHICFRL